MLDRPAHSFVIVAVVLFFVVIKPVNHLMSGWDGHRRRTRPRECPECLSTVPEAASRCAYCTSAIAPVTPAA